VGPHLLEHGDALVQAVCKLRLRVGAQVLERRAAAAARELLRQVVCEGARSALWVGGARGRGGEGSSLKCTSDSVSDAKRWTNTLVSN
jgi:hypothetical protein